MHHEGYSEKVISRTIDGDGNVVIPDSLESYNDYFEAQLSVAKGQHDD